MNDNDFENELRNVMTSDADKNKLIKENVKQAVFKRTYPQNIKLFCHKHSTPL